MLRILLTRSQSNAHARLFGTLVPPAEWSLKDLKLTDSDDNVPIVKQDQVESLCRLAGISLVGQEEKCSMNEVIHDINIILRCAQQLKTAASSSSHEPFINFSTAA